MIRTWKTLMVTRQKVRWTGSSQHSVLELMNSLERVKVPLRMPPPLAA